ncbi:Gp37-like protein [Solibacillus isronensis]|uniref:Gp37-like protein n=1 Tax=Solibacillus isronensis TaxID=412383 RepID=UPI0039A37A45
MKKIELWVFDMNFNRLAVIDTYKDVTLTTHYQDHSPLTFIVEGSKETAALLMVDEDRIIVKSNDIARGYYIENPQYTDERNIEIEISCRSLSVMMGWRIIKGQQNYRGNIEDVIKFFVKQNAITPTDPNRIIPNLVIGVNQGINLFVDETYINTQLDVAIWEICKKHDIGFEILMNHQAKKYVVSTFVGINRSTEQMKNPHVIFSKEFENVTKQSYVDDRADFKSTAFVGGIDTTIVLNNASSGYNRRELYVDATNISKTYRDENDIEVTMTDNEYIATISDSGQSKLAEYPRIRTFETDIAINSQYDYNVDYFIGDIVTTRNDELGIISHPRIITAFENWNRDGYSLSLDFGASIPKLLDKIKREIKNSGGNGVNTRGGKDGVGIEYTVSNSTFGIKREDESDFTYITLAEQGPKGEDGISITHSWSDTVLTITSAAGTSSVDLKGPKGNTGERGLPGYTPIKGIDYFDGKDGRDGVNGYTPVKGIDYFDGVNGRDGKDGIDGNDGYTPIKGVDYFDGSDGRDGIDGKSAYETAVINGFIGTEAQWLSSLKGEKGEPGTTISEWSEISNKPVTFTPSPHNHQITEVEGLQGILDNINPSQGGDNTFTYNNVSYRYNFEIDSSGTLVFVYEPI